MVTAVELQQVMPNLKKQTLDKYLPFLQEAMAEFEINTYLREAAFIAQLAHESGELRFMEEIWGPTPAQLRYEPPSRKARELGNNQPGDGFRYKGRGPIQLTGRANYQQYGNVLKIDLLAHPEQAATPEVGFRIACLYWKQHDLNALADREEFVTITRRINGGVNGLQDRQKYYERAKLALSKEDLLPEAVRVLVNGTEVKDACAFLKEGHVIVALRPVTDTAGWRILEAVAGHATIQDTARKNHEFPMLMKGNTGFVRLIDLPGTCAYDNQTHTASLTTRA